jgi:hypothetical protein
MSATHLVVLPTANDSKGGEPISHRILRLQAEAKTLAHEHVEQLRAALADVARLSGEISDGGEAYPVGARELARRLAEEAGHQALTLGAINDRALN